MSISHFVGLWRTKCDLGILEGDTIKQAEMKEKIQGEFTSDLASLVCEMIRWLGCSVLALHSVVAGSISSGGDYCIHSWFDLIRSKQLFSVPVYRVQVFVGFSGRGNSIHNINSQPELCSVSSSLLSEVRSLREEMFYHYFEVCESIWTQISWCLDINLFYDKYDYQRQLFGYYAILRFSEVWIRV